MKNVQKVKIFLLVVQDTIERPIPILNHGGTESLGLEITCTAR